MKQRLSVRAIISEGGKVLLLRRATGRESILGKYELPGGKLAYKEQPEDALRRYLHDDAGIHIQSAQLFDGVTYIDHDDREIQYGVMVYLVTRASQNHPLALSGNYDKYQWHSLSSLHQSELTDLTQLLLGIMHQEAITDESKQTVSDIVDENASDSTVMLFSDGGSRGNPGPSAAGFVIVNRQREQVGEGGAFLGITTSNQAEYQALLLGLQEVLRLGYTSVDVKLDSMLVVQQMKGAYKVKNRELWPIHERIRELLPKFTHVSFSHVPREYNQLADGMVNKILNSQESSPSKEA